MDSLAVWARSCLRVLLAKASKGLVQPAELLLERRRVDHADWALPPTGRAGRCG